MKLFERWETEEVELTFGLKHDRNLQKLKDWLASDEAISESENAILIKAQEKFKNYVDYFNEDEIKFFFISKVIEVVDFANENYYRAFTQRKMTVNLPNVEGEETTLYGRVEFVVARGKQTPRHPFFFLNKYKPEQKSGNDPKGQLLASMVAAQAMNQEDLPIYGAYINGRNWFFVVLEDKKYAVSEAFDSTQDDLFRIVSILKNCKIRIENYFITHP